MQFYVTDILAIFIDFCVLFNCANNQITNIWATVTFFLEDLQFVMETTVYLAAFLLFTSASNTLAVPTTFELFDHTTSPSFESCPQDSHIFEGTCKCNPDSCVKPPCISVLNLIKESTDIPGNCCPIYSCDGCANETKIDGKCPCATGAVLNDAGQCECVDKFKTIKNDECVCDESKCELPELCDDKSVAVKKLDGCCYKTNCIKCPEDSYPTSYNNEQVEDKCACFPCIQTQCGANQTAVVIRRGTGFPGKCCNLYDCKIATNQTCVVNETIYTEGDAWETPGGIKCKCQNGISLCSQPNEYVMTRSCLADGKVYNHLETWVEDIHNCTNCTCIDGTPKCISHMCLVNQSEIKKTDCPPMSSCSKNCPNGYKLNKRGCEICKCNIVPKINPLDDVLQQFNMSKTQLLFILNNWKNEGATTTTTTTTTPSPITNPEEHSLVAILKQFSINKDDLLKILLTHHDTTTKIHLQNEHEEDVFPTTMDFLIMIISVLVGIGLSMTACFFYQFCKKNKDLIRYKYKPVKKDKNENNNISKIYT